MASYALEDGIDDWARAGDDYVKLRGESWEAVLKM